MGVICDHGSANLNEKVFSYLNDCGIEVVPAGPGNPRETARMKALLVK